MILEGPVSGSAEKVIPIKPSIRPASSLEDYNGLLEVIVKNYALQATVDPLHFPPDQQETAIGYYDKLFSEIREKNDPKNRLFVAVVEGKEGPQVIGGVGLTAQIEPWLLEWIKRGDETQDEQLMDVYSLVDKGLGQAHSWFVDPDYQGLKIGKLLHDCVVNEAIQVGMPGIILFTSWPQGRRLQHKIYPNTTTLGAETVFRTETFPGREASIRFIRF